MSSPPASLQLPSPRTMYNALARRDRAFDGVFYIGVKTTGIFCRPTCTARKPLAKNVEFFPTAPSALAAGYRACKRCRPLDQPGTPPAWLIKLRDEVDSNPSLHLRDADLRARKLEPATARRHFLRHDGMTFHAYARARRVGQALKTIRSPRTTMTQLHSAAGYESESGFREACQRLLGEPTRGGTGQGGASQGGTGQRTALGPMTGVNGNDTSHREIHILSARWLTTPLGPMLALADDSGLHALEYIDRRGLERQLLRLRKSLHAAITPGDHPHLDAIEKELANYFAGKSTLGHPLPNSPSLREGAGGREKGRTSAQQTLEFPAQTARQSAASPLPLPLTPRGSPFQHQVWNELRKIPLGTTISYGELAKRIGRPTASRAVARANGDNFLAIIIPCHRVIGSDGSPTGYGGGIWRKLWLLDHERKMLGA